MTGPAALPAVTLARPGLARPLGVYRFRAMACEVSLTLDPSESDAVAVLEAVHALFEQVERECTRFDPSSDLMRANAAGEDWCDVGPWCLAALDEALTAHHRTAGRFDPRVLQALHRIGYVGSLPFARGPVQVPAPGRPPLGQGSRWTPRIDRQSGRVAVGSVPVDLGGIGKGLAVRWASEQAARLCPAFVLDAGGDCRLHGTAPGGALWQVGVEDPRGSTVPVVVLALQDTACATSSIRLRSWRAGAEPVHHLIDPRTGLPGGAGLLAVTVVDPDAARAEVWSKALFLHGAGGIAAAAADQDAAALWVGVDGDVHVSDGLRPMVVWEAA